MTPKTLVVFTSLEAAKRVRSSESMADGPEPRHPGSVAHSLLLMTRGLSPPCDILASSSIKRRG